jgi:hypothetical protein
MVNMKTFFETPTQVMFYDTDGSGEYNCGIAWGDHIICGCCGGVFEISEVIEFAPEGVQAIYAYDSWVDLSEEIFGGEYPPEFLPQDRED